MMGQQMPNLAQPTQQMQAQQPEQQFAYLPQQTTQLPQQMAQLPQQMAQLPQHRMGQQPNQMQYQQGHVAPQMAPPVTAPTDQGKTWSKSGSGGGGGGGGWGKKYDTAPWWTPKNQDWNTGTWAKDASSKEPVQKVDDGQQNKAPNAKPDEVMDQALAPEAGSRNRRFNTKTIHWCPKCFEKLYLGRDLCLNRDCTLFLAVQPNLYLI
jgi:hypothetical protein